MNLIVKSARSVTVVEVEIDGWDSHYKTFRRCGPADWEALMGCSWEPVDEEQFETVYQRWLKVQDDE